MFKIVIYCGFDILHKPKTNNFASESFVRIVHRFVAHTDQDNEDIYFLLLDKLNLNYFPQLLWFILGHNTRNWCRFYILFVVLT